MEEEIKESKFLGTKWSQARLSVKSIDKYFPNANCGDVVMNMVIKKGSERTYKFTKTDDGWRYFEVKDI